MPAAKQPKRAITWSAPKGLVPITFILLVLAAIARPSTPLPTLLGSLLRQVHALSPIQPYLGLAPSPKTDVQALAQIRWGAGSFVKVLVGLHLVEAALMAAFVASKGASLPQIVLWTLSHIPCGFPNYFHFKKVNRHAL